MNMKSNYIWMLSSKLISIFVTLFTAGLINRMLGPDSRGILAEIQTWVALFATVFGLSMDSVIYHFANKKIYDYKDGDKFVTAAVLTVGYTFAACIACFITAWIFPSRFSTEAKGLIQLLSLLIITTMLSSNLAVIFQAWGKIKLSSMISIVQAAVNFVLIYGAFILKVIGLRYVIICLIFIQVTAIILFIIFAFKAGYVFGRFSKQLAKGMIIAGSKQHVATIFTFIYTRVNQLIIVQYCGSKEAGLYAVSLSLVFALMIIPSTLQAVLYPRVIHSDDDYEITIRMLRISFYGWGFAILLAFIAAKPILLIYGGTDFISSVASFRILLLTAWFLPLSSMGAPYYIKVGAFIMASLSAVLLGIISIVLNLLLVPAYRGVGAALATSISCAIGFIMVIAFLRYLSKKNSLRFLNIKEEYQLIASKYLRNY